MPDLNDPMIPVIGELVSKAQTPPDLLVQLESPASIAALFWRTGYQNALSDLIAELWPDKAGGIRLSAQEIADDDVRRRRVREAIQEIVDDDAP